MEPSGFTRETREVITLPDGRRAQVVKLYGPAGGKGIIVTPLTTALRGGHDR